jgi:hypothetical protein
MLFVAVELHVAARDRDFRFIVKFNVVRAQPDIPVNNIHIAVGKEFLAHLPLLIGFQFHDSLPSGQSLLGARRSP